MMIMLPLLVAVGCNACTFESPKDKDRSPPIEESEAGADSPEPDPERPTFIDISLGQTFACGVRTEGTLQCWGESEHVPAGNNWRRVEQAGDLTCALDSDGKVCCWGVDGFAGDCSDRGIAYPEGSFVDLTVGQVFACGLDVDGRVTCWGDIAGSGTAMLESSDTAVLDITSNTTNLSALHADGSYSHWLVNRTRTPPIQRNVAGAIVENEHDIIMLVDFSGAVAVQPSGLILQFDRLSSSPDQFYTYEVGNTGPNAVAVHGDENAFCARYEDGHVACESEYNDTGIYQVQYSADPPADQRFIDFDLYQDTNSGSKGCGVLEDGHLACWAHVLPNTKMFRDLP